jgi:hypothetical protein
MLFGRGRWLADFAWREFSVTAGDERRSEAIIRKLSSRRILLVRFMVVYVIARELPEQSVSRSASKRNTAPVNPRADHPQRVVVRRLW